MRRYNVLGPPVGFMKPARFVSREEFNQMQSRTMVERVANEIQTTIWVAGPDVDIELCRKAARMALVVMREVTKEMVYAGDIALDSCQDSDYCSDADGNRSDYTTINSDAPSIIWKAMIDAALSEGLPSSDKQDHISRP